MTIVNNWFDHPKKLGFTVFVCCSHGSPGGFDGELKDVAIDGAETYNGSA